jgi:pimeloyl-ACP methyl ester carboxylesterase
VQKKRVALPNSRFENSGEVCQREYNPLTECVLPKTKYARSGDVRIAYQITGDGPFDVVWAPGTMSHLDLDWELPQRALFFERFSKFCRLIRFDKRGTGLSDRPVHMATLEERTDDIRAVMDDVGIRGANVFGVSEGGSHGLLTTASLRQASL